MRRRLAWLALFGIAIVVTVLYHTKKVMATPADGFVGTTIAQARFGEIEVFNHQVLPSTGHEGHERHEKNIWLSLQKTKGSSDVYVQSNVWQPGGSTGWHTHPGHSLIIVTAGTLTAYEGNDPELQAHYLYGGDGLCRSGRRTRTHYSE